MDKLEWSKVRDNVAIHVPCSSKKMGIEAAFNAVAQKCSHQITSSDVPCCGEHTQPPLYTVDTMVFIKNKKRFNNNNYYYYCVYALQDLL